MDIYQINIVSLHSETKGASDGIVIPSSLRVKHVPFPIALTHVRGGDFCAAIG